MRINGATFEILVEESCERFGGLRFALLDQPHPGQFGRQTFVQLRDPTGRVYRDGVSRQLCDDQLFNSQVDRFGVTLGDFAQTDGHPPPVRSNKLNSPLSARIT